MSFIDIRIGTSTYTLLLVLKTEIMFNVWLLKSYFWNSSNTPNQEGGGVGGVSKDQECFEVGIARKWRKTKHHCFESI